MDIIPITDPADPRIAMYGRVSDGELLRDRGVFVAEGRQVVERLLGRPDYLPESLLLNASALEALRPHLLRRGLRAPIYQCDTSAFEAVTGVNFHRGCLALVRRPPEVNWRDVAVNSNLLVVLEQITNADNVGGVFRNAAAFGAGAVLLSPTCCDPLYRKAIRTSTGAVFNVPFARFSSWPDGLAGLRDDGFTVVALSPRGPAITLDEFAATSRASRVALVVGTEGAGLSEAAESQAHVRVGIPMTNRVDSLNLAVATGIALSRIAQETILRSAR